MSSEQQPKSSTEHLNSEDIKQALKALVEEENGTRALEIVNIISYFAAHKIPTRILLSLVNQKEELDECIKLLKQHLMVASDENGDVLNVDISIQNIVKGNLQEQKREEEVLRKAIDLLYKNKINWSSVEHALSVWKHASVLQEPIKESVWLPSQILEELLKQYRYKEADSIAWNAFELLKRIVGENHSETLTLQQKLGALLESQGKFKEALEILQPLLEMELRNNEKRDTEILMARQLKELSRSNEALEIYERLFHDKNVSETSDEKLLSAWNDYAILLSSLGKTSEAIELIEEIINRKTEISGAKDDGVLDMKISIGVIYKKQSKFREAERIFEEIYEVRKKLLGEDHIKTSETRLELAMLYFDQNKRDKALQILEDIRARYDQVCGGLHHITLVIRCNIAAIYLFQTDYKRALDILEDVYEKMCKTLGPKHVKTTDVHFNLATALAFRGSLDESIKHHKEVYEEVTECYGKDDLRTLHMKNTLPKLVMLRNETVCSLAKKDDVSGIIFFIQRGEDINIKDDTGKMPLHYAAQFGHIDVVKQLLENNAVYNIKDGDGKTPSQYAQTSALKVLFNSVEKLFKAVMDGNDEEVRKLLNKEIVNAKEDNGGYSALHWAVHKEHESIVLLLLKYGADATRVTSKGNTPLHLAVARGNEEIFWMLLDHVVDTGGNLIDYINSKTSLGGNSVLHVACKNGYLSFVRIMLKRGATYNIKNNDGQTPLDLSTNQKVTDLMKLIGELFEDAKNGNEEIHCKLRGAEFPNFCPAIYARNEEGKTIKEVAVDNNHKKISDNLYVNIVMQI